jgi:hypothetical protein
MREVRARDPVANRGDELHDHVSGIVTRQHNCIAPVQDPQLRLWCGRVRPADKEALQIVGLIPAIESGYVIILRSFRGQRPPRSISFEYERKPQPKSLFALHGAERHVKQYITPLDQGGAR